MLAAVSIVWLSSKWSSNAREWFRSDNYVDTLRHLVRRSHLFNYPGSLTTPPCTESVDWWVLNNPLSISPRQYERLLESYKELPETDDGSSNRPTQPLHGRKIKYL